MPLQGFVDSSLPTIKAAWLNAVDAFYFTLFNSATTAAAARTAIGAAATTDLASYLLLAGGTLTGSLTFAATTPAINIVIGICEGRLTLTSGTPVTTADVTAAGTIYFAPYKGNRIAVYDGAANWTLFTFSELSLALTLTSGKPYDVFCYNNAGVLTLEVLVWTNDTTRATALTTQNGVLVKTGATTRRYLGTLYSSGANTTEDSLVKRYLWNYYNRVRRPMRVAEATDTWTYTTATFHQANASAANQLDYVMGVLEDTVDAKIIASAHSDQAAGGIRFSVGVGVDSTTVSSSLMATLVNQVVNGDVWLSAEYSGFPGVGRHTLKWLEQSTATGTTTWNGDAGAPTTAQSGIIGSVWA